MASITLNSIMKKSVAAPAAAPVEVAEEVEVVAEEATPVVTKPAIKSLTKPLAPAAKPTQTLAGAKPVAKPAPVAAKPIAAAKPVAKTAVAVVKAAPIVEADPEETSVALTNGPTPLGSIDGEVTSRDMAIPYLQLLQKQSPLFDTMTDSLGNWVYDKQIDLGDEIEAVFLRATKYYLQKLPFESKDIPGRFVSAVDYRAAGFNDAQVVEVADLDLLIAVPQEGNEAIGELTTIAADGNWYLPARYTVRSSAYGKTFSILVRDRTGWLKGNLLNGSYKIGRERRSNTETSWFVPSMTPGSKTSDEFKDIVIGALSLG